MSQDDDKVDDIARLLDSEEGDSDLLPPEITEDLTALVSLKVLRGAAICFAYRDQPDEGDSGWTLLSGDEPDAWLEDPDRFEERTLGWVLDRDPTMLAILGLPPETSVERERLGAEWAELEEDDDD